MSRKFLTIVELLQYIKSYVACVKHFSQAAVVSYLVEMRTNIER